MSTSYIKLYLQPISLKAAGEFINKFHRHHKAPRGCKFCIAVNDGVSIRAVAIIGRPVSRHLDDGYTLEVTRLCSDGTPNACSMLLGSAWRAARALAYRRLISYLLASEAGTVMLAAGWQVIGERGGGAWSRAARPRKDFHPLERKMLYQMSIL